MPTEMTTLRLDILLDRLKNQQKEILTEIDQDPLLKRRTHSSGIIIANAGPKLFQPQFEHQLFAKGIVYSPNFKLVSLPLVKMYNHGLREHNDATTIAVERLPGIRMVFPEKLDGTMIQLFEHNGQAILTTRSMMEGLETQEEDSIFLKLARNILEQKYPQLLDPKVLADKSLIFELIHPKSRQITRYGARQDMVVLSVFDQRTYRYWAQHVIEQWATEVGAATPEILLQHDDLEVAIERIRQLLDDDPALPEGTIIGFEQGDVLIHRVKVKMATYLEHFSARLHVSYKTTVNILWNAPHLHDWPAFLNHLITEQMSEEEVELLYRDYFDQFIQWYNDLKTQQTTILSIFQQWLEQHGPLPDDRVLKNLHIKDFAIWAKANHADHFHLLMLRLRKGTLSMPQLMWHQPAYSGMRQILEEHLYP